MKLSQDALLTSIQNEAQRAVAKLKSFGKAGCILVLLNYQCEQAMDTFGVNIKEICAPFTTTKDGTHTKWEKEHYALFGHLGVSDIPASTFAQAAQKLATASALARSKTGELDRPCKSNSWTQYGLVNPDDYGELAKFATICFTNCDEGICDHSLFDGMPIPKSQPWLKIGVSVVGGDNKDNQIVQSAAIEAAKKYFNIGLSEQFTAIG